MKTFKSFNKKLDDIFVPIVMKDIQRIDELQRYKEEAVTQENVFKELELESYISYLKEFFETFQEKIGNNLRQTSHRENTEQILQTLVGKLIIIGDDTPPQQGVSYNCHGWAFGNVKWLNLEVKKSDFITALSIEKQTLTSSTCDAQQRSFFTTDSNLVEVGNIVKNSGSVAVYYDTQSSKLTHTARYVELLDWYRYDPDVHTSWYDKNQGLITFNEDNQCLVNNYTSKLGMGYNVVHEVEDLMPLYGDIVQFYDLV
jgi:hypothetical protein